jgi:hypothetical protein
MPKAELVRKYDPEKYRAWYTKNSEKKKLYSKSYYSKNAESRLEYARNYKQENPGFWRKSHLKRLYNTTEEDVQKLKENQNFKCAICDVEFDDSKKSTKPHIDHNHETGKVRGILCQTCNTSLGHVERKWFIEKAMNYLVKHEG